MNLAGSGSDLAKSGLNLTKCGLHREWIRLAESGCEVFDSGRTSF
jgi:hypothetical protein